MFSSIIRGLLLALVAVGFTLALVDIYIEKSMFGFLWLALIICFIWFHAELWKYWLEPKTAIAFLEYGFYLMLVTDIGLFFSSRNHKITKAERRLFRVFGFVFFVAFVIVGILGARHVEVYRFTSYYGPILKLFSKLGLV